MENRPGGDPHRSFSAASSRRPDDSAGWGDFRGVVEASEDLLTVLDGEGRILYDNPAVEAMLGYRQGELVGRSAFELIHPEEYARAVTLLAALATGPKTKAALAFRFLRRDGVWCWLSSTGRVVAGAPHAPRIVVTSRACSTPAAVERWDADPGSEFRGELEDARVEVVERLARAAEFRDDDTGQHLRRVGELAAALGARLSLAPREVEVLRRTAPLHDVGKIGIPDAILLKPGLLAAEEEEIMRTHPVLGARILAGGGTALVRAAEEIALSHHERWDGGGYPRGLSGAQTPLFARIVSVVDVFDALTHDRPYRRAWERARALELIRGETGSRFDPAVAAAFLTLAGDQPPCPPPEPWM